MMDAIDLFAGLGGNSEGARMAGVNVVWAANHWQSAVEIHEANHPRTTHVCQDLHQADWTQVPAHDLLMASPACQGHTHARGKERPHHDATRSTAWAVVSAAEYHRPTFVVVENVPEFTAWKLYPAWCAAMSALGYALAPMILDAADCGVPQHRRRLFVVGTRSRHPIELQIQPRQHVPAASFVDFRTGKWTPINRPGRSARTLARVTADRALSATPVAQEPVAWLRMDEIQKLPFMLHAGKERPQAIGNWVPAYTAPVAAQAQPCNHVFEARPINDSRRASTLVEAVCRKCGYRPEGGDHG